jgi:hypothetical protein
VLRLAAVAHGLEDGLDERFAQAPARLTELSARDPWTADAATVRTVLLAALVRAEQIDYGSFVPAADTPMTLRDALADPDDMATVAAVVRWETLMRLGVSTPDRLLDSWLRHVASIARDAGTWDPSEYVNTLDIRSHLRRFAGVLSWAGQAQWREHIEPADETFRACTERRAAPLALAGGREASPAEWWRYRHPIGFSAEDRDALTTDVEAGRYVSGTTRLGDWGSLRRREYDEAARHEQQRRLGDAGSTRP